MEQLSGFQVSSTQVSKLTAQLDTEFEQWRNRPLTEIRYLTLDATYYKVRIDGSVRDCAALKTSLNASPWQPLAAMPILPSAKRRTSPNQTRTSPACGQ